MNLGRAKMVLIIAFSGLNLFLGYYLFWPDVGRLAGGSTITPEEQRLAEDWLNDNNYYTQTNYDRSIRTGNFLTVSADHLLRARILDRFPEDISLPIDSLETRYYRGEEGSLVLHPTGLLQISFEPGLVLSPAVLIDERSVRNAVRELLTEEELLPEQAVFDHLKMTTNNDSILHYHQEYNGLPLFAGTFRVFLESNLVTQVDLYWLRPDEDPALREMEIISATEALTSLVDELGPSPVPRRFLEVELGYYSGEYDAEKWEVPPVWRIIIDDGQQYYINAFTGNIEQEAILPEQLQ